MRLTIELPLTPALVLERAHSAYWYGQKAYEPKPKPLTERRLRKGIALLAFLPFGYGGTLMGKFLSGEADGSAFDMLLQLSLLGEVKYG